MNLIPKDFYGFLKDLIMEIAHQCKQQEEAYEMAVWITLDTVIHVDYLVV